MINNFEQSSHEEPPEQIKYTDKDLVILSGDLEELKEDIEIHTLIKFANVVLNSFDNEAEEVEEDEED
jgi:hypothetical protein